MSTLPHTYTVEYSLTMLTCILRILRATIPSFSSCFAFSVESCKRPMRFTLPLFWTLLFFLKEKKNESATVTQLNITPILKALVLFKEHLLLRKNLITGITFLTNQQK